MLQELYQLLKTLEHKIVDEPRIYVTAGDMSLNVSCFWRNGLHYTRTLSIDDIELFNGDQKEAVKLVLDSVNREYGKKLYVLLDPEPAVEESAV